MRRSTLPVLALAALLFVSGCTTRQKIAGGGLALAVVGVSLTFSTEVRAESSTAGNVGIGLLLTGLATLFVAAALEESAAKSKPKEIRVATKSEVEASDQRAAAAAQKKRDQAWALTKQAQEAARVKDCAKVTELSAQVGALDRAFFADVFMKDLAVQQCFVPTESTPAPTAPLPAPVPVTP